MTVKERLAALRAVMAQKKVDALIVPTADFHQSEYVGDYFKARAWLSGFTGSAGTLVVMADWAGLWTDGRYFIQAERQLAGSGIELCRMGVEGVPTESEYLLANLKEGQTLAFDGRVLPGSEGEMLCRELAKKGVSVDCSKDFPGMIWTDRPAMSCTPAFLLEEKYAGRSAAEKLSDVRRVMADRGASAHLLTTLDDIAWLFNIRADDVACTPVLLSYALVTMDQALLYVNPDAISEEVKAGLKASGIALRPYEGIYEAAEELAGETVLLNGKKVNYALYSVLQERASIVDEANPEQLMKAVKNETEVANLRLSHIRDGVAFTKFMYWLKNSVGRVKMRITESSAAEYLEDRRREQPGFIEPSFTTISAYGPNAAMMHYSATPESDADLLPEGLYLVDSGGQYYEGTTDITRTMALGPVPDEQKKHFTAVCRSVLALQNAVFLEGCRGINLDILARGPIWEMGIDYRCGTGHGVGYLSGVHEAPNGFRWKIVPERNDSAVLEPGMVTTDEPGVYIEGSHGIRTENELLCVAGEKNEYGQFLHFECLTFAPIDLDAIDPQYLSEREKGWLNAYHKEVFEKLSPYLTGDETEWLRKYTRAI
ncbi:MAG: aminopeptidase P family protein [Oscillospiraceae bacterium]|nr:aminopeptidase P family protein [Oscillospiraceae bacterium]